MGKTASQKKELPLPCLDRLQQAIRARSNLVVVVVVELAPLPSLPLMSQGVLTGLGSLGGTVGCLETATT